MNTYAQETQTLISGAVTVPVYADLVPESAPLPAIAWYNTGYQKASRLISGIKEPTIITQRVMIVVDVTNTEMFDDILSELEVIDNTKNADFQQIEVFVVNMETVQPDSPVQRCMVDLVLTTH